MAVTIAINIAVEREMTIEKGRGRPVRSSQIGRRGYTISVALAIHHPFQLGHAPKEHGRMLPL